MRLPLPVTPVAAKGERTWREGVRLNDPNGVSVYRHVPWRVHKVYSSDERRSFGSGDGDRLDHHRVRRPIVAVGGRLGDRLHNPL